jgi:hypothetical protein
MEQASCLGFNIACDVLIKGAGVTICGLLLFVGSIYVLLAAVFGRWMGYLVLSVAFWGWLMIQSSLWLFGFWSQGPDTPVNLGPRGPEAAWTVKAAGHAICDDACRESEDAAYGEYPAGTWSPVAPEELTGAEPQAIQGAATAYLAEEANAELGRDEFAPDALTATNFVVDGVSTSTDANGAPIAVVEAHFLGGGPQTTVALYYDEGNVAAYSWMFLIVSGVLLLVHIPLLDRAERSRREFLTGGTATPWYGPA